MPGLKGSDFYDQKWLLDRLKIDGISLGFNGIVYDFHFIDFRKVTMMEFD
jgi:hypothetical protein